MTEWLGPFAFLLPSVKDVVQIILVAVGFHYVLRLLARTRAIQMLIGVVLLALVYFAARLLDLELVVVIMETLFEYGAIAALIVFQPELRSALAKLGQGAIGARGGATLVTVFALGDTLAPAPDLSAAIVGLRKRAPAGVTLQVVPVNVRDWSAMMPKDASASVMAVIAQLTARE